MAFIEPCFGIGHNLSLICQMTSEDIKHQLIILTSTETIRLFKDREKGGRGYGGGGRGREIIYLSLHCHMTSAFRWAAVRAILMCHNCEGQSPQPQTTTFEEKGEPKQIRTELPLPTARPNRLTSLFDVGFTVLLFTLPVSTYAEHK